MIQNLKNSMKRSKYLRLLLVVPMVVLFLYCSVTLVNQSADISRMQKQKQTLTAQLASVQQENARLEEVVGADNKDDYIEQKAREKMSVYSYYIHKLTELIEPYIFIRIVILCIWICFKRRYRNHLFVLCIMLFERLLAV